MSDIKHITICEGGLKNRALDVHKLSRIESAQARLAANETLETDLTPTDPDFDLVRNTITDKLQGYRATDIRKGLYDVALFVTLDDVLKLMSISQQRCHHCGAEYRVLYTKHRDKMQWSLDRIVNSIGHNRDNVVVSCLHCNISRRDKAYGTFHDSKNIQVNKNPTT